MSNLTAEQNVGHGHVFPRPDGVRARCGGPAMCSECAKDLARKKKQKRSRVAVADALAESARAYAGDVGLSRPHPLWDAIEAYENMRAGVKR